jgi:hypothetical protein
MTGPSILQGPHQSAQKSTTTIPLETVSLKFVLLSSIVMVRLQMFIDILIQAAILGKCLYRNVPNSLPELAVLSADCQKRA